METNYWLTINDNIIHGAEYSHLNDIPNEFFDEESGEMINISYKRNVFISYKIIM